MSNINEDEVKFRMRVHTDVIDVEVDELGEFLICTFLCGSTSNVPIPVKGLQLLAFDAPYVYFV